MLRVILISLVSLLLMSCATTSKYMTPRGMSELQQGKRNFEAGYYKRAMKYLLPLACDGVGEAEYAVGYMYYYGLGVAQDTDVGYFWIKRAANQGCKPAITALKTIETNQNVSQKKKLKYPSTIDDDAFYY